MPAFTAIAEKAKGQPRGLRQSGTRGAQWATAEALSALVEQALADVDASANLAALDEVRVRLLARKGCSRTS